MATTASHYHHNDDTLYSRNHAAVKRGHNYWSFVHNRDSCERLIWFSTYLQPDCLHRRLSHHLRPQGLRVMFSWANCMEMTRCDVCSINNATCRHSSLITMDWLMIKCLVQQIPISYVNLFYVAKVYHSEFQLDETEFWKRK